MNSVSKSTKATTVVTS